VGARLADWAAEGFWQGLVLYRETFPTMKTRILALLLVLSAGLSPLAAQAAPAQGFQSMKIHATDLPTFPATLVARGITSGSVRLAVRIDPNGQLDDWLVVAYTEEILANAAVQSLKKWRFTPAMLDGEPVSAQSELSISFRVDGVVINQNIVEHFLDIVGRRDGPPLVFQPVTLREIDRIPTPLKVVSPFYSTEMRGQGMAGSVTVDFYIDDKGHVRMPVVGRNENPDLAGLAIEAVRQWEFEPPTRRGRPVLVHARQRFNFGGE
jgi:TonB family protein